VDDLDVTALRILIVDDISKNIQVVGNILKRVGYSLSFATSGAQALDMAMTEPFDLILLDVMMPQMDGYEVCARLKEKSETRDIPVIFLTARTALDDITRGFHAGAVDYVTKPFNSEELLARVRTHLGLKASADTVRRKNEELAAGNEELERVNAQLRQALDEIKTLRGLLPICANCKKIRLKDADPRKQESWIGLEEYLTRHTEAEFSHGICPECLERYYPKIYREFTGSKKS
jgi:DNA-binding response OmpR family regulator